MLTEGRVSMWRVSLGQNGWTGYIKSEKKTVLMYKARLFPTDGALEGHSGHPGQWPPPPSALLTCPWVPLLPAAQAPFLPVPSLSLEMTNDNSQLGQDR